MQHLLIMEYRQIIQIISKCLWELGQKVLSHLFPALSPSVQWESVVRSLGYLLQLAGFDSKAAVQNDDVINVIVLCVLILPAIVNVVAIVIFSKGYPITKEKLNEQTYLLREKRSKAGISE